MRQPLRTILAVMFFVLPASMALSQYHGHGPEEGHLFYDPAVAPLILPTVDDFLPPPPEDTDPDDAAPSGLGLGGYIDVTGETKLFNFSPWYNFSDALAVKVRVPWIFQRKLSYLDFSTDTTVEAKAAGIGDIGVDVEYTHRFKAPSRALRLQGSVKLPTGDQEKMDGDYRVPLGSGSVDLLARAQYAQSTTSTGLLVTGLYRRNSAGETIQQYAYEVLTTRTTNGHQVIGAAFGRYRTTDRLWLHLGFSLMFTADGKVEEESRPTDGDPSTWDAVLEQKSTLVDLFPGLSWNLGKLSPYLGVRIPLVTSYDKDYIEQDRKLAVTLQVSYRPERLF